jgi:DNA-directed RNA polymerase subunit RPC12/RpoP
MIYPNSSSLDSRYRIRKSICKGCGEKFMKRMSKRRKYCSSLCWNKNRGGKNSWNWSGGKSLCSDCGKITSTYKSVRCTKCAKKFMIGENAANWRNGIYLNNPRAYKAMKQRMRLAIQKNSGGSFTQEEWEKIKEKYDFRCPSCNNLEPDIKLTVDHIIPISKGGMNTIKNIQPLCRSCNSKKKDKIVKFSLSPMEYKLLTLES